MDLHHALNAKRSREKGGLRAKLIARVVATARSILLAKSEARTPMWRFKETPIVASKEGTLGNSSTTLGPIISMLGSPSVAKKILGGVIPPVDKEKVDKLTLDQVITKFFHIIGQVSIWFQIHSSFLSFH